MRSLPRFLLIFRIVPVRATGYNARPRPMKYEPMDDSK
jgi:hypothetical protein